MLFDQQHIGPVMLYPVGHVLQGALGVGSIVADQGAAQDGLVPAVVGAYFGG